MMKLWKKKVKRVKVIIKGLVLNWQMERKQILRQIFYIRYAIRY